MKFGIKWDTKRNSSMGKGKQGKGSKGTEKSENVGV